MKTEEKENQCSLQFTICCGLCGFIYVPYIQFYSFKLSIKSKKNREKRKLFTQCFPAVTRCFMLVYLSYKVAYDKEKLLLMSKKIDKHIFRKTAKNGNKQIFLSNSVL